MKHKIYDLMQVTAC